MGLNFPQTWSLVPLESPVDVVWLYVLRSVYQEGLCPLRQMIFAVDFPVFYNSGVWHDA